MEISSGDLEAIQDGDKFVQFFTAYSKDVMHLARLLPVFSRPRVIETHGAWCEDLSRVSEREKHLKDGMDHFKRAGHLAFWIRRMSPVVEAVDTTKNFADAESYALSARENQFRDLLFGYCNEYLALDLGFQFCLFYEIEGGSERAKNLKLSDDYIR